MKEVLVIGSGKTLLNIATELLTSDVDLDIKIETEETKKLSDYEGELNLLTRRKKV